MSQEPKTLAAIQANNGVVAGKAVAPKQAPLQGETRLVVATRRGYYGLQIRDPEGNDQERAPFPVPADAEASWWAPAKSRPAEDDIA